MRRITLSGWNVGFDKVGLTNLLRQDLGYSLARAKGITDAVLDKRSVTVQVPDYQVVQMDAKLKAIRARFAVDENAGVADSD